MFWISAAGKSDDAYYIVTDRWQKFTDVEVTPEKLGSLEIIVMSF